jgi:hypothetical protein
VTKQKRPPPPDLRQIRRALLTAVASDDQLFEQLVFKGGNALELIHKIGERASLDLDFSMEGDTADAADLEVRLRRAVSDRLDSLGFLVFDWKFGPRPNTPREGFARWGGYRAEFKVIEASGTIWARSDASPWSWAPSTSASSRWTSASSSSAGAAPRSTSITIGFRSTRPR